MTVHNHGTEDGPGLSCPERLRGDCMVRKLPDLGVLAGITRAELIQLTDALGLDPAYVGSVTIGPDSIAIHTFDPKTTAVTTRLVRVLDSWDQDEAPAADPLPEGVIVTPAGTLVVKW